jgi:DNA-binding GntR family transcriptional regulator
MNHFASVSDINATADGTGLDSVLDPMQPVTLADACYKQLKDAIVTLEIRPGTPLSEAQIASRLGISKSPVREALQRLSRDGLVTLEPNRRCVVTGLDPQRIGDWYELRLILEPASLLRVAPLIDSGTLDRLHAINSAALEAYDRQDLPGFIINSDQFHLSLVHLNPNRTLVDVVDDLFNRIRRVRIALYQQDLMGGQPSFTRDGLLRHEAVMRALHATSFEEAANLLQADIQRFLDILSSGEVANALERVAFRKREK